MWVMAGLLAALVILLPLWAIIAIVRQRRELRELRVRLERLESHGVRGAEPLSVVPPPVPIAPGAPEPAHAPIPLAPPARRDTSSAEELIGGIWLQNVGAVLLLLGVFFLILWGYTTGRLGPGVLVAAGVLLGLALGWRGDRMARTLPLLGHALIGVGLGTIYLSLYLGHFTLHALPALAAFVSLPAVAIGSVVVGLHYRVQTIAALGVLGAFVPQLMAAWIPIQGFTMAPAALLGYMATINAAVFLLSARAGWSGLDLAALLMSTVTWLLQDCSMPWGWGFEGALTAMYMALGLSPLPRLVHHDGSARPIDLAVIGFAPVCLAAASWPLLAAASPHAAAAFLALLALLYLLAALWVDTRRPERDLWRPLTGAAMVFVTAAIERMLGQVWTPLAWCVEGTVLAWLGLTKRGAWLRFCGTLVMSLGALWLLTTMLTRVDWPAGLRELAGLAAILSGSVLLARGREHLTAEERYLPELWTGLGNFLLVMWIGLAARHFADTWVEGGGPWLRGPGASAVQLLAPHLMSTGWLAQALILLAAGRPPEGGFLRTCGYVIVAVAVVTLILTASPGDRWGGGGFPGLHPLGILRLIEIGLIAGMAVVLAANRAELGAREQRTPEVGSAIANLLLMNWIAIEAGRLARLVAQAPANADVGSAQTQIAVMGASFTSAGWLVQALAMLVIGWVARSAFLRWSGLALAGLTVLKFLLVDLQTVDVFWRFLTAIVAGAALLGISYAYQRRTRRAA
jgi:uncharacterized membrane protein